MPLKSIVWLASYPKSGNTWTRIFLANYLFNPDRPVPINEVHRIGIGDSISGAYKIVGKGRYDPADYVGHLRMREKVLRGIVNNDADMNFVKTHNIKQKAFGFELILKRYSRSAIYILRDPRDVTISYARHYGLTPSKAAVAISRDDNTTMADKGSVKQYLGHWSKHVKTWTTTRDFPVHVMRYEDMIADPHESFRAMLGFLGLDPTDERLDKAVRFSSFDELRAQETRSGFIEASRNAPSFFHSGTARQWEGKLTEEDLAFLSREHGPIMQKYGYL